MTREKVRRILIPAALCAAFFAVLLILVASLDDIALGPGEVPSGDEAGDGKNEDGAGRGLIVDAQLLRHVLFVAFSVSLGIVLVSALFARMLRRWLYFAIGLFGALLIFDLFASRIPSRPDVPVGDAAPQRIIALDDSEPVHWSRILVALGLSVGAGGALLIGSSWIASRWRACSSHRRDAGLLWEMERLAQQTFSAGRDNDLVLHCYRQMVDLLSRRGQIAHASLTAREFAACLRAVGLRTAAVDRLTELFELVRYGHRDSTPLADRAVASLEEIRRSDAAQGI